MNLGLKNKVALVTGGSKGMAKAIAKTLVEEGATVIIAARTEETLKKAAAEVNADDYVSCDLSKSSDIERLYSTVSEKHGKIDVLVNNTGGPPAGSVDSFEEKDWEENFQNTVMSVVRLVKLVLPGMKEQKFGRIINIESTSVKQPIPSLLFSNSLRPGVIGFSKTIAGEVAKYNITINTIAPGSIDTEHLRELAESWGKNQGKTKEEMLQSLEQGAPIGRLGKPEEIAHVVAFLASEQASFITGTTVSVDGGKIQSLW